jgi:hypothetical protein
MTALLSAVMNLIQHEFSKPEPRWRRIYTLSAQDKRDLETECNTTSEFDPTGSRKKMYMAFIQGKLPFEIRECEYGRVIALYDNARQSVPWGLWGRILRTYASKGSATRARVFFLASPSLREFPHKTSDPITPRHINGGYTYNGDNRSIMIYRAEDATRVLIHELQHASSLDHMECGVDQVEAETEAWAELLYMGFLSMGDQAMFEALVGIQSEWIVSQNKRVKKHIGQTHAFPWRYTVGKEEVWHRWGILKRTFSFRPTSTSPFYSLRLTAPPWADLKELHEVQADSTIL